DDLDAAYAELDDRYLAAESVPSAHNWVNVVSHNLRAAAAGGWDQLASLFSPHLVMEDHRPVRGLRLRSRDEGVASVPSRLDVRHDARLRVDHVLGIIERRSLAVVRWEGGEPEGIFEIPIVVVTQYRSDGKTQRCDLYNLDQLDAARACYQELAVRVSPLRIENAATRRGDRFMNAWAAGDWEGVGATFAPGFRLSDRTRDAHFDLDRDQALEYMRFRFEMRSSGSTSEILATRGHRLALTRSRFDLADRDIRPSETESLAVSETDEHGDCVALVMFEPDDLDAAYAELDDRYAAGESAPYARNWVDL